MELKDVLVYLDGLKGTEVTMQSAAWLAKQHQARLTGLHVIGYPLPNQTGVDLSSTSNLVNSGETLEMIYESALTIASRAENVFRKHLRAQQLSGAWRRAEGMVAYTAGVTARRFDVTVVGQIDPEHPPLGSRKLVPDALILESGRPVLIIPCHSQHAEVGTRVLVGWDSSREAARTVNDALPILEKAASVTVVTFNQEAGEITGTDVDPAEVASHVAEHGLHATVQHRQLQGERIANALIRYAAEMEADLLVMGGYSHSRLQEAMLGGTTQRVLRHMMIPVLMSH